MPDQLHGIVQRMIDAGESEDNIALVIQHYKPEAPADAGHAQRDAYAKQLMGHNAPKLSAAQKGGVIGGLAMVPFTGGMSAIPALATAGLGAAGGAGYGMLAKGIGTGDFGTPSGNAKEMGVQFATGAGGEGAGRLESTIANHAVPRILKGIYRPSPSIQKEFPDVIETIRREQIPIGTSAAEKAHARMMASSKEAQGMVDAASPTAAPVSPREIVKEFRPLRDQIAANAENASPTAAGDMAELVARAKGLRAQGPKDLARNQTLKQAAQTEANNAFTAANQGRPINDTTMKLNKAVAVGRQKAGEARFPGVGDENPLHAANANTQSLMGLEDTLADAHRRNSSMFGFNPLHVAADLFPGTSSTMTFGADAISKTLGQPTARALRQAILAILAGQEDQ